MMFALNAQSQTDTTATAPLPLGENEGIVKFFVQVDNGYFEVLLEDSLLIKQFMDTLVEGHYSAKVWSPGYVTVPIEFDVKAGETTNKVVEMAYSNKKQQFEQDYAVYRKSFHKHVTAPAAVTLVSGMTTLAFMIRSYDLRRQLLLDVVEYDYAGTNKDVNVVKSRIELNNKKYNRNRAIFYTGCGLTTLFLAGTIASSIKFKKTYKEPFLDSKSPWHDRFSMGVTPYGCLIQWKIG